MFFLKKLLQTNDIRTKLIAQVGDAVRLAGGYINTFIRIKVFHHSNCDMEEEYVNSPIGYGTTVVTVVMEDMKGLHFMICS